MPQVVALLSRPGPKSFRQVPLVVRDPQGTLRTCGLAPNHVLTEEDLRSLAEEDDALLLDVSLPDVPDDHVAGWLGESFANRARALPHGPGAPVLPPGTRRTSLGSFWVASPQEAQEVRLEWIRRAARCVIGPSEMSGGDRAYLVGMMSWAMPDADETKAARLCVQRASDAREQELKLLLRTEQEAGRPTVRAELAARLRRVAEQYGWVDPGR